MSKEAFDRKSIRVVSQSFDGPLDKEVQTLNEIYPMLSGNGRKWTAEEIEVKLTTMLQQIIYSGFNVTISNESDPSLGMGGYRPKLEVRPDYQTVRAAMTNIAAAKAYFAKHGAHAFTPPPVAQFDPSKFSRGDPDA